MPQDLYRRIHDNPKFKILAARRSRFAWTLSAIVLIVYYGWVLTVGFAPEWLGRPIAEGMTTSIGIPIGAGIIVLSWILTGVYVYKANTDFDRANDELLKDSYK